MENVDLTKAKKVVARSELADVNKYLDAGWKLIDTASGKDEMGYPLTRYSLAWLGDGEPVEPKLY